MTAIKTTIGAKDEARDLLVQRISGLTALQAQEALAEIVALLTALGGSAVTGPASSTDNAIARFDGTGGDTLQDSLVTIGDTGIMNGAIAVGVNATADTTNRLSVNSAAVLFNHAGAGTQIKVNKNATGDTGSYLFQTGFSGRAEFGTIGDNDFTLKTSSDGSVFTTALIADNSTGAVRVGVNLRPSANDGAALGTTTVGWADLFGATGFTWNIANGNWLATHTSGIVTVGTGDWRVTTAGTNTASVVTVGGTQTLTAKTLTSPIITTSPTAAGATWTDLGTVTTADINGGTIDGAVIGGASAAAATVTTLVVNTNANPDANDGAGLGTGALGWSDLFLASGGVVNWANGDVTITHSSNLLTWAGATSGYSFDTNVAAGSFSASGSTVGYVGLTLTSTEAAAAPGPLIVLDRNSASPADQDDSGQIIFRGRDSAANATDYVRIFGRATTVNNGTEEGQFVLEVMKAGTVTPTLVMNSGEFRASSSNPNLTLGSATTPWATAYVTNLELGNAADTTITRSAAGVIAVEGVPIYSNIPQNSQSAAYTTVLADAQKHILHPTADNNARTFTIAANASVAYPVGTAITFVNQINTVTIAINSDTLTLAGSGSTGSRTLAANGIATALKVASTSWVISGVGLT